jgi:hypothetical protein
MATHSDPRVSYVRHDKRHRPTKESPILIPDFFLSVRSTRVPDTVFPSPP